MSVHKMELTGRQVIFLATLLQKIDMASEFYGDPRWKGSNAEERALFDGLMDKMLSMEEEANAGLAPAPRPYL